MKLCLRRGCAIDGSGNMLGTPLCLHKAFIRFEYILARAGDAQLIQPKLQNRQQKAPETTTQASKPPSGKALGSTLACSAFSISDPNGSSATSGMMFASVLEIGGSIECGNDDELSTLENFGSSAIVEAKLDSTMIDVSGLENLNLLLTSNGDSTFRHKPAECGSGRRFIKRSDTGSIRNS